jgi:hypothetical protein
MTNFPPSRAFELPGETRVQRADRWRARADELRAIADTMHHEPARDGLLVVAKRLDVLAVWLDGHPE